MRRSDREITDFQELITVMRGCDVCRLALHDEPYPYILPLNFGLEVDGETVSSTRIRALVQQGDVAAAERLLGRPFGYDFEIVRGRQLGRTMGTPTINQVFTEGFVLPRFGVYASLVSLNDGDYYGVTNVGVKPTVGADAPLSETWIPEYHGEELYGENIRVDLIDFIRPEKKFSGIEELQNNILQNAETAKKIISAYLQKEMPVV